MVAQVQEAEKVFKETAGTFGLSVTILIVLVLTLSFVLWWLARTALRWVQPKVEEFFVAHLKTMQVVQDAISIQTANLAQMTQSSKEQTDQQKLVANTLAESTKRQMKLLDDLKLATDQTNRILTGNSRAQLDAIKAVEGAVKESHDDKG